MSRRVSISLKTARALRELGYRPGHVTSEQLRALQDLEHAMEPKKSVSASRVRRVAKKATKKERTSTLRIALFERSRGHCELCGDEGSDMHHALSRRVTQDISNVLFLCRRCHRDITNNRPSVVDVLQAQASKFGELGFSRTADALLRRRDFVLARGAA